MTRLSPGALARNLYGLSPGEQDSLRVRATLTTLLEGHGALTAQPSARAVVKHEGGKTTITVGAITALVDALGHIRFLRTDSGAELLAEKPIHFWWPGPRNFTATGTVINSSSSPSPLMKTNGSSGWASIPTGAWTKRA